MELRPETNGMSIDVGTDVPGTLGLTDAELDRITAGSILIGDANSGPITVSAAITRSAATNLNLTTATNKNITFDASGAIDANSGNVTLTSDIAGSGGIFGGASTPHHVTETNPGRVSDIVGMSGSEANRRSLATASALSLPART